MFKDFLTAFAPDADFFFFFFSSNFISLIFTLFYEMPAKFFRSSMNWI